MGYFKNEEETRKTINSNGYIKSGDIGKIVKDQLIITGRSKELLITAGGENVAPVLIENEVVFKVFIFFSLKHEIFKDSVSKIQERKAFQINI